MTTLAMQNAVNTLLDGRLGAEDHARLQALFLEDKEALKYYRDCVGIHCGLQNHQEFKKALVPSLVLVERVLERERKRTLKISLLGAAAAMVLIAVVLRMMSYQAPLPGIAYELSSDAAASIGHPEGAVAKPGELVPGSSISLTSGSAALTLVSGVESLVVAPTKVTLLADGSLEMHGGKGWFKVPKKVKGFRVLLPGLEVLDLGTEFAIEAAGSSSGNRLHVIVGSVRATGKFGRGESKILKAGEAVELNPIGMLVEIPYEGGDFHRKLPSFTGIVDLKLNDEVRGLSSTTLPPLGGSYGYDDNDGQWGHGTDSPQAISSTNGEVWVSRQDLGEAPPQLETVISGLEAGRLYEVSLLFPVHSYLPWGIIRAAVGGNVLESFSRSDASPTGNPAHREFHEVRCVIGTSVSDPDGNLTVRLAPSIVPGSRSYISAIGVEVAPSNQ